MHQFLSSVTDAQRGCWLARDESPATEPYCMVGIFHTVTLLTLPCNTLLSSQGGVFGKDPGLFDRVLFCTAIYSSDSKERSHFDSFP
tara:strand:- start:150 stop:410 length:261 start_codon:yes stop_codon:yes gene_type:complete